MNVKIDGRWFRWSSSDRLTYVRKGMVRRWVPAPYESATHVIHAWLPTVDAPWLFKIRRVGKP